MTDEDKAFPPPDLNPIPDYRSRKKLLFGVPLGATAFLALFPIGYVVDEWWFSGWETYVFAIVFVLLGTAMLGALVLLVSVIATAIADKAEKAGRSWLGFYWLSWLISPIITGLIALSFKPVTAAATPVGAAGQSSLVGQNAGESEQESKAVSLEQRLTELQNLRDKGLISEDEYQESRRKQLGI